MHPNSKIQISKYWDKQTYKAGFELNVLADFDPKVSDDFASSEIVVLGNLHPAIQGAVLDQLVKKPDAIILDTMNFWMDSAIKELLKIIKRVG